MDPKPKLNYNSFESIVLSLSHPNWKTLQPVLFVIVYRAPGPYSDFISEFSEFLSSLVLKSDKVIIVGDFNVHVDVTNDSLSNAFTSLIDSGLLVVPIVSKSRTGARAFSYQAPLQWNQLPVVVREADTLSTFKGRVKTFLFDKAYS